MIVGLVEPKETVSEDVVTLSEKSLKSSPEEESLQLQLQLPFVVNEEKEINVTFNCDTDAQINEREVETAVPQLVSLVQWTVSHVDKESETCVLSCSLSVDSDKLYKMKELPLIQIEVKTEDGLKSHKHDVTLKLGKFLFRAFVLATV